jgi:hypothetical protein
MFRRSERQKVANNYRTTEVLGTCKMRNEIKPKRNEINRNEIHRNETKFTETKRNGIIQNEIKPILTKQFLGEIQDKN